MAKRSAYAVVVATDGSPQARAAVAVAAVFPWPRRARLRVVLARGGVVATPLPGPIWAAVERGIERVALDACRVLRRHWPEADFAVVDQTPVEGVLAAARRGKARAVVVGVRGQGAIGRFVLGSVSRGVLRRAPCAVLVVKGRPREMRRLVVGLDGCVCLEPRRAAGRARRAGPDR
jgi:nucleotide-binding universal stress UspA family protein